MKTKHCWNPKECEVCQQNEIVASLDKEVSQMENETREIERAVRKAMTHLEDAYHHIMNAETLTQPQKDLLFNILADASKVLKSSQEVTK